MASSDPPPNPPYLSIVPSEPDPLIEQQQSFQLNQQELDSRERELQLKDKELDLRKKEIEVKQIEQKHELEMKRLQHGLNVDTFQRGTKSVVSILGMVAGVYFHVCGDNIGYFLMGAGMSGFGITMSSAAQASSKDDQ